MPAGSKPGNVGWKSSFHIGDRVASELAVGRVALAGDAAHIHSPVGARGMSLGIADAYVYAACAEDIIRAAPNESKTILAYDILFTKRL
jgi:2-polyprenyl-6-methoxyphenol hydroxylase-like FAD-dependent oxidoreductase